MAFSLGPNGQFRSASAPGVGGCPPPTSPNVSSPKMSNLWQSDSFSFACSLCQSQNISTFASVTRRLGAVTISLLKRSVGCLAVGCRGWRGRQDSTGQWDTPCDRLEPLRIRWSLTLLGLTRSSFSIPGQSTWLEQC